jgi:hypothetical protein
MENSNSKRQPNGDDDRTWFRCDIPWGMNCKCYLRSKGLYCSFRYLSIDWVNEYKPNNCPYSAYEIYEWMNWDEQYTSRW